ncbi:MAG: hypothetical protein M1828_007634 [Chrysothrix sp. TS-e1954]|nr:MAG: hypothetical protein M1828_007634 [Chrysothrix sp. TS-e1954]
MSEYRYSRLLRGRSSILHIPKGDGCTSEGIFGFFNLKYIPPRRLFIVLLLTLSSVPLHLLYNSTVYTSLSSYEGLQVVATPDFETGGSFSIAHQFNQTADDPGHLIALQKTLAARGPSLQYIDSASCLESLEFDANNANTTRVSYQNNLVVVSNATRLPILDAWGTDFINSQTQPSSIGSVLNHYVVGRLDCLGASSFNAMLNDDTYPPPPVGSRWCSSFYMGQGRDASPGITVFTGPPYYGAYNFGIDHCLATNIKPRCSVLYSRTLSLVVIFCNFLKLVGYCALLLLPSFNPLITAGDALASFLAEEDLTTTGDGPVSFHQLRQRIRGSRVRMFERHFGSKDMYAKVDELVTQKVKCSRGLEGKILSHNTFRGPGQGTYWRGHQRPLKNALSRSRWWLVIIAWSLTLGTALVLLAIGAVKAKRSSSVASKFDWSLGQSTDSDLVGAFSANRSFATLALIVNMPQLLISLLYLMLNSALACVLLAKEIGKHGSISKPLRVSKPIGQQKGTYFLQIPYAYSVPLLVLMILLHWLVSESFYLVSINEYRFTGEYLGPYIRAIGYSSGPQVFALVIGLTLLLSVLIFARVTTYPKHMPMLSSCSLALSAACHRDDDESGDIAQQSLKYGVLRAKTAEGLPRAGFTARQDDVVPLEMNKLYH